jgi:hypothetical protein
VADPQDSYADDLFHDGQVFMDEFRTPTVRPAP